VTLDDASAALLRRAIALAVRARESGNPPFGSLLVDRSGVVLAEDVNTTVTEQDVSAHPELKLARWADRHLTPDQVAGVTMYTSCEPCPMCTWAMERVGVVRVVFSLSSADLAAARPSPPVAGLHRDGPHLVDEGGAAVRD
jgi:tRNA(Arg) A34 adenosine deaminase TadA